MMFPYQYQIEARTTIDANKLRHYERIARAVAELPEWSVGAQAQRCVFCGAHFMVGHADDCAWVLAQKLTKRLDE